MFKIEKFILPISLILVALILGGSFYFTQKEKTTIKYLVNKNKKMDLEKNDTVDIKEFFKENLKKEGFKKRGNTFYKKTNNETYFVVHMQRSQWSDSYYFNIGIKYNGIEDSFNLWNEKKVEYDITDFQIRLGETITDNISEFRGILLSSVENNQSKKLYIKILNYLNNFFENHKTKELFKMKYKIYSDLPNIGITKELVEYCEK